MAPIVPIVDVSQITEPELRDSLRQEGIVPVDFALFPELAPALEMLTRLTQDLLLPKDGKTPIRLMLVDDLGVNACFFRKERIVGVNLGLLRFVESDDELAFVLGHELEHGTSELQQEVDSLRRRSQQKKSRVLEWLGALLQRSVENEVDVKSVVYRVHEKGFNPHAATHFIERLDRTFPDLLNVNGTYVSVGTHTLSASRDDTIGMAITALARELGEETRANTPDQFTTRRLAPVKKFLESEPFRELQSRRIEEFLAIPRAQNPAFEAYQAVKDQVYLTGGKPRDFKALHREALEKKQTRLYGLAYGLVDDRKLERLRLDLTRSYDQAFDRAREQVLGPGFRPSTPDQLRALVDLDRREHKFNAALIVARRHQIRKLGEELRKNQRRLWTTVNAERREELHSLVESQQKRIEFNRQQLGLMMVPFGDPVPREVEEHLDRTEQAWIKNQHCEEGIESEMDLTGFTPLGELRDRARAREGQTLAGNLDLLLQKPSSVGDWGKNLELALRLPEVVRAEAARPFLKAHLEAAREILGRESKAARRHAPDAEIQAEEKLLKDLYLEPVAIERLDGG
ncbi:MAG: M48 family metalloprotease [Armatimonadetes bacterium]|nr:M48 family metalloprotease [Armatimonadota bacterium]